MEGLVQTNGTEVVSSANWTKSIEKKYKLVSQSSQILAEMPDDVIPQSQHDGQRAEKCGMASIPTKTPVSLLQELCVRRGITPKYDLLQVEGAVHEPTFLYRATVGEFVATGQGQSKKKAKHSAAKAVLDQLLGKQATQPTPDGQPPLITPQTPPYSPNSVVSPYDDGIPGNPVGSLQELCMSRRWPPPTYDLLKEEGLPHERTFSIQCCIGKHREPGNGKSKKLAKRQAAYRMLQLLKDQPTESGDGSLLAEDDDEIAQKMTMRYSGLKESKISTLTPHHSTKVSQFHRNLKSSTGKRLSELQNTSLSSLAMNYIQFLQEIAAEQNFEVTYVDIDEKSRADHVQCLVQLSTLPVAVCYGFGEDSKAAQAEAAHNALEYLKIMTKK